ncbi:MAG: Fic family protein [Nitrososphaera sp.]
MRRNILQELYTEEDIDGIIEYNRRLMLRRKEDFEADRDILIKIFSRVNAIGPAEVPNSRERTIQKASRILSGIAFRQPFHEGNKTTALFTTIDYLRQNGYDLPLETIAQEQEVFDLLVLVMYGSKEAEDVRDFLDKRIVTYAAR